MGRLLIISSMPVLNDDGYLTGPTIRFWEMARALQRAGISVTLADPGLKKPTHRDGIPLVPWTFHSIREVAESFDLCIIGHYMARQLLRKLKKRPVVVDFFDPEFFALSGSLNLFRRKRKHIRRLKRIRKHLHTAARKGTFFLCANQRQHDWLLGLLTAAGRLDGIPFSDLPVGIVPTGAPPEAFPGTENRLRGTLVPEKTRIVLWPGGLYPWFDGITPLLAMKVVLERLPDTVLVYWGARNPVSPEFSKRGFRLVHQKAKELGWLGRHVFFADWLPYDQRGAIYREANLGVLCYHESLETYFSFRTRMVDCLWGGLPLLTTRGDTVSHLIERYRAGRILESSADWRAWGAAMVEMLEDPDRLQEMGRRAKQLAQEELSWDTGILPLVQWVKDRFPPTKTDPPPPRQG